MVVVVLLSMTLLSLSTAIEPHESDFEAGPQRGTRDGEGATLLCDRRGDFTP